jgi:hypothetical protein
MNYETPDVASVTIKTDEFKKELATLINRYSLENLWDMPDFLMAELLENFILSASGPMKKNLDWHGVDSICHPKPQEPA